jgi:hypothetical protein
VSRDDRERFGEIGMIAVPCCSDDTLAGLDQRFAGATLVQYDEFRGHARLQRKPAQ